MKEKKSISFYFHPLFYQIKTAIEEELKEQKLQVNPHSITKVVQLYETKSSRHSVMIVGGTQSTKTVTWRVLQATMGRLNRAGDQTAQPVKVAVKPSQFSKSKENIFNISINFVKGFKIIVRK